MNTLRAHDIRTMLRDLNCVDEMLNFMEGQDSSLRDVTKQSRAWTDSIRTKLMAAAIVDVAVEECPFGDEVDASEVTIARERGMAAVEEMNHANNQTP